MRRSLAHFALPTLALLAVPFIGCAPSDDSENVQFAAEYEPNDASATATALGASGYYVFQGSCSAESADWFQASADAGVIEVTLRVSPGVEPDPDPEFVAGAARLSVRSASQDLLAEEGEVTPSNPAQITGPAAAPGTIYVEIGCPTGERLDYWGTVRVP